MKRTGFSTIMISCAAFVAFVAFVAFAANAGGLSNGTWSPSGCGARPEPPVVDSTSVSTYNQSIAQIKDWQKHIQIYHECVIKEANSDIAAINQSATAEQTKINQASGSLNQDLNRGREKLDSSSAPASGMPSMPQGMQGYQ